MTQIQAHDREAQRAILSDARVIAVVGYSADPTRTSYEIGGYLKRAGYRVYAVNPTVREIDGEKVYATLADVPEPIDIVNVFRRSEFLPGVVDDAIQVGAKTVWAQLGVFDAEAARKAEEAGINIVMNLCIKVAHRSLIG
jgi:predicted CoA-binding protein